MTALQNQPETPEDQQYICNEFQRANALMNKLSEKQQIVAIKKMELEKAIMAKQGVNDRDLWKELKECRIEIDAFAQEKLLLVAKLYNLAQKFVQELDVATEEASKQMQQSNQNGRAAGASYKDMMMMNAMRNEPASHSTAGKNFDETMIEPVGGDYSGKDMMGMAGKGHRKSRGQQRASDGKFESGFERGVAGRKGSAQYGGGGFGDQAMSKVETQGSRKGGQGGRKRAGGGTVGSAFYDGALGGGSQPEPVLQSSISGKFSDSMEGISGLGGHDEENKAMFDGQQSLVGSIGLADNAINIEEGICQKCQKPRPPNEQPTAEENLVWICCEKCETWFHALCVQDILLKQGITGVTEEDLDGIDFFCCNDDQ